MGLGKQQIHGKLYHNIGSSYKYIKLVCLTFSFKEAPPKLLGRVGDPAPLKSEGLPGAYIEGEGNGGSISYLTVIEQK